MIFQTQNITAVDGIIIPTQGIPIVLPTLNTKNKTYKNGAPTPQKRWKYLLLIYWILYSHQHPKHHPNFLQKKRFETSFDHPCFGDTYGYTPSCTVPYSWNSCWLLCYAHVLKIQTKTNQMHSTPRRSTLVIFIRWNQHIFKMKLQNPYPPWN